MSQNVRKSNYPYPVNLVLDILEADSPEEVWNTSMPDDMPEAVEFALTHLKDRASLILHERYQKHKTLTEIGDELGISNCRVRQIEVYALAKLRRWFPEECGLLTKGLAAYNQYAAEEKYKETHAKELRRAALGGNMPIDDLNISTRIYTRLLLGGYRYASEVAATSEDDLMRLKSFGAKSYQDV